MFLSEKQIKDYQTDGVLIIKDVFKDNWIAPIGPHLNMFEEKVKEYTGSKYAVAVTSCTAGIHLALRALRVKEGDYVLCSSLTFAATVNPIIYCGAEPIFIDSDLLRSILTEL